MFGCLSKKIRRKALAENLDLARLIQSARAEETAHANADEIEKTSASLQEGSSEVYSVKSIWQIQLQISQYSRQGCIWAPQQFIQRERAKPCSGHDSEPPGG